MPSELVGLRLGGRVRPSIDAERWRRIQRRQDGPGPPGRPRRVIDAQTTTSLPDAGDDGHWPGIRPANVANRIDPSLDCRRSAGSAPPHRRTAPTTARAMSPAIRRRGRPGRSATRAATYRHRRDPTASVMVEARAIASAADPSSVSPGRRRPAGRPPERRRPRQSPAFADNANGTLLSETAAACADESARPVRDDNDGR